MKFGQTLKEQLHPPWAQHYLNYNPLKKLISVICAVEGIADEDDEREPATLPCPTASRHHRHRIQPTDL